jgi:hypothetical protein
MAGKSQNRKSLESAVYIAVDSLDLARMPAGWEKRGKAIRAVMVQHRCRNRTDAETELRAVVEKTAGVAVLEHRGADGMLIEQCVGLAAVPQHFGGQRWFFVCPVTGSRARKLYRYPGMRTFCSRRGLSEPVTYRCQRDSGAKRVVRQIWEVRGRLGAKGGLLSAFDKPDGMNDAEFFRHLSRYLQLASRLDFSADGIKMKRAD